MQDEPNRAPMTAKLVNALYVEAMVLADEARSYFDEQAAREREALPPLARVAFACESLRVTTRLMHVIAWLLTQKAVGSGEISAAEARTPERRLGEGPPADHRMASLFPQAARDLITASQELYDRVRRLDRIGGGPHAEFSPARTLMSRLERSF